MQYLMAGSDRTARNPRRYSLSMNELIPTVITDKNGRVTTVRKRQDARRSASRSLSGAVPTISATTPVKARSATPLVMPSPLSEEEAREFLHQNERFLSNVPFDGLATSHQVIKNMLDGVTQAQIKGMLEQGTITIPALDRLLIEYRRDIKSQYKNKSHITTSVARDHLQTALLLAEGVAKEHPTLTPSEGVDFANYLRSIVSGNGYRTKMAERLPFEMPETVEEVKEMTAIAALTLYDFKHNSYSGYYAKRSVFKNRAGIEVVDARYLQSRSLDAFLRENPQEVNRVLDYLDNRLLGHTAKDTANLVRYLSESEELGPVSDGWL